jgi:hypothetical protein
MDINLTIREISSKIEGLQRKVEQLESHGRVTAKAQVKKSPATTQGTTKPKGDGSKFQRRFRLPPQNPVPMAKQRKSPSSTRLSERTTTTGVRQGPSQFLKIENMIPVWGEDGCEFIETCMQVPESSDPGVSKLEIISGSQEVLPAICRYTPKISVETARKLHLISAEDTIAPGAQIRPLIIHIPGLFSEGNLIRQFLAAANTISPELTRILETLLMQFGMDVEGHQTVLDTANATILSYIEAEQRKFSSEKLAVVITGHSLGGMLAQSVAMINNISSIVWNPVGLGEECLKLVSRTGSTALNEKEADKHLILTVEGDFTSAPGHIIAEGCKFPGKQVIIPTQMLGDNPDFITIHQGTQQAFANAVAQFC